MADYTHLIDFLDAEIVQVENREWERLADDADSHIYMVRLSLIDAVDHCSREQYSEAFTKLEFVVRFAIMSMDAICEQVTPLKECRHCGQPFSVILACMCHDEAGNPVSGEE